MSPNSDCELCIGASITTRYYDDEVCWIADCLVCGVPMVVWRVHDPTPPTPVRTRLRERLAQVAARYYDGGEWHYDDHMRNIPDHYHGHARPGGEVGTGPGKR